MRKNWLFNAVLDDANRPIEHKEKDKCIFTVLDSDNPMFKVWYNYHKKFYDEEDIYILDSSDDGKGEYKPCVKLSNANVINARDIWHLCNKYNNTDLYKNWNKPSVLDGIETVNLNTLVDINSVGRWADIVKFFYNILSIRYKVVLKLDHDELAYHTHGIDLYIKSFINERVDLQIPFSRFRRFRGTEIIQIIDESNINSDFIEKKLNWDKPILSQRKYWKETEMYSKPALMKSIPSFPLSPEDWPMGLGGHSQTDEIDIVEGLYLIHLKMVDFDYYYEMCKYNLKERLDHNPSGYRENRIVIDKTKEILFSTSNNFFESEKELKVFWPTVIGDGKYTELQKIPEEIINGRLF